MRCRWIARNFSLHPWNFFFQPNKIRRKKIFISIIKKMWTRIKNSIQFFLPTQTYTNSLWKIQYEKKNFLLFDEKKRNFPSKMDKKYLFRAEWVEVKLRRVRKHSFFIYLVCYGLHFNDLYMINFVKKESYADK
jgi:hypothetical protein